MKEVGRILKITHRTVAFHKYRVKDALNAKSNSEVFQYAIKHLLIAA